MGPLFDQNVTAPTPNNDDNPDNVPSFFTYFGQFLDHDMTLDTLPPPMSPVDPTTIPNHRDPRLTLDSVYLGGPDANPELYQADGKRLKVNGRDLPRNPDGSAIIGDGRNDENQVIAQIHVVFLRAHNKLIDDGYGFGNARQLMQWRHQWIVVHEFLKEVLDRVVYDDVFRSNGSIHTRYYDPKHARDAVMPVEFSVAAYRFGHSHVRKAYIMTQGGPKIQVFNPPNDDLHGGRPVASDHIIFWPNFLPIGGQPAANISRKIDTLLSSGLFTLPIPGAAPAGSAILAKRNIQRGREYGLPSGQAVATYLRDSFAGDNIDVLSNADIASAIVRLGFLDNPNDNPDAAASYLGELPLWLYILAESQIVHNGAKLGPVGSRIVAEVIGGLLLADNKSYYNKGWTPPGGDFRAQDLLSAAGVLP
jgi:Animal haem peroxidase